MKQLHRNKNDNAKSHHTPPSRFDNTKHIAIIGIACRLPGAENYQQFWDNLIQGKNNISEVTPDRWDINKHYSPNRDEPNKSISKWGGLLDQMNTFDANFFNISPREAVVMDPQQRLLLEETWHCVEDSGVALKELQNNKTSVYVGVMAIDYQHRMFDAGHITDSYDCLGNYEGILANRLSYSFNFTGESQSIDVACASSLVAIHNARRSLMIGESDYAIAAGVNIICHPWKYISFSKSNMLSPDGQCKTFDAQANGYVPGEGVGVLLLCTLQKAIEKGYQIYGVIKGSAVKHTGRSRSITSPRVEIEKQVIEEAIKDSEISSDKITYIEAHGTGTSLGDPIEVEALTQAFHTTQKQFCKIGSVKTNIGHLEAAAGVASVIKVLLMLQHHKIPQTLNIKTVNPIINFEDSPFRVAAQLSDWNLPSTVAHRYAGVSSFGFGGVNAHVVLEEYTNDPAIAECSEDYPLSRHRERGRGEGKKLFYPHPPPLPFILSAKTATSLQALQKKWQTYVKSEDFQSQSLSDICYTLTNGRKSFRYRSAALVECKQDLIRAIDKSIQNDSEYFDTRAMLNKQSIIFRILSQPSFTYSVFENICQQYPILLELEIECKKEIKNIKGQQRLLEQIHHSDAPLFQQIRSFIFLFVLSKAFLKSGVRPQYIMGNGIGLLVGTVISGMLTFSSAIQWLMDKKEKIVLNRPSIPLYDTDSSKIIEPYRITTAYCEALVEKLAIDASSLDLFFNEVRQLYANQFTFKKLLAQWDNILIKYDMVIANAINNPQTLDKKQQLLLCIILIVCLKKLNEKWKLTEKISIRQTNIQEMVDLILDRVLPPEDAVALLLNANDDVSEKIVNHIQKHVSRLDAKKPYTILKRWNQQLLEIPDHKTWLEEKLKDDQAIEVSTTSIHQPLFVDIGGHSFLNSKHAQHHLVSSLVKWWQAGFSIQWDLWFSSNHHHPVALPVYPFQKEFYWIQDGFIDSNTNTLPIHPEEAQQANNEEDIAIIGMDGNFPGSPDLNIFWDNLIQGKDLIGEIPRNRWDWQAYYGDGENQTKIKWGGFLDNVDQFDAKFFNISRREAELMDPQQRIFLETIWKTIENSGYTQTDLAACKTGLFVGVSGIDYSELIRQAKQLSPYVPTGIFHCLVPNRISYLLDLHGPSEPVDTACSSSLFAIHRAVKAIQNKDCDLAIAGAVSTLVSPNTFIEFTKAGMLSPDGRCKTFDQSANGYVRGEGAGAILLKPLSKALTDGDTIYGVIKGTAVNHGGHVNSLTVPNPNAQAEVIRSAVERAKVPIDTISYIEAHGTGTSLGDPIEINGLKKAFRMLQEQQGLSALPKHYCGLGSVKINIGHLEPTAGIAGVIKVLLAMRAGKLPGLLHFKQLNPYIDIKESPFFIVDKNMEWKRIQDIKGDSIPRRAGVSSFGFGGANGHVLLEEAPPNNKRLQANKPYYLITLSAKTVEALKLRISDLSVWIAKHNDISLENLSFTLNAGRMHFKKRCACVVKTIEELSKTLHLIEQNTVPRNAFVSYEDVKQVDKNKLARLNQQLSTLMLADEKKYQDTLIQFANAYTEGYVLDWHLLHQGEAKQRIAAPTYPFTRETYWIPNIEAIFTPISQQKSTNLKLHPLIDVIDADCMIENQTSFSKSLSGTEFYLIDHCVRGIQVFPGAAYLELARDAGQLARPTERVTTLENVIWMRPMSMQDKEPKLMLIKFTGAGAKMSFQVTSKDKGESIMHAQGKVVYGSTSAPSKQDIAAIKARCTLQQEQKAMYKSFLECGLEYGPGFRVIQAYKHHENEALSYIALAPTLENAQEKFVLHPALLDGMFQSTYGLLQDKNALYLPFGVEQISIYGALPNKFYTYVKLVSKADKQYRFTIQALDEEGNIIVHIKDFVLRAVQTTLTAEARDAKTLAAPSSSVYYCQPLWVSKPLTKHQEILGVIVVFEDDGQLVNALRHKYSHQLVIQIKSGNDFRKLNETTYQMNRDKMNDYIHLLNTIKETHQAPKYFLLKSRLTTATLSASTINEKLHESFYPIFYLSKALIQTKAGEEIKIAYLAEKVDDENGLFIDALFGFAKTVQLEKPNIKIQIVTSVLPFAQITESLIDILALNEWLVRYNENQRSPDDSILVKRFQEISTKSPINDLLKKRGVYLITGGLGGLGLIFAHYLAQHYQATLILTGRKPPNDKQAATIAELEKLGAQVVYMSADVTKPEDVKQVLEKVQHEFKSLNGIIHAAGVLRDAYLYQKTIQETEEVIAAKIFGTWYLDELTKNLPLDFFILFSSIVGVMGNVGQCDYAFANGWMDAFAAHREQLRKQHQRHGKSLAINWPLWSEGGMQIVEASVKLMERSMGAVPLKTNDGILAFLTALAMDSSQSVVLVGHKEKLEKGLGIIAPERQATTNASTPNTGVREEKQPLVTADPSDDVSLLECLKTNLISSMSTILKISKEEINADEPFSVYGMDSISTTEFIIAISDFYQLDLTPAILFEHQTLNSFVNYLLANYSKNIASKHQNTGQINTNPSVNKIENHVPSTTDITDQVKAKLSEFLATVLKMQINDVNADEPLSTYGMDSISTTEFIIEVSDFYQLDLTPAILFEHQTLNSFCEYLLNNHANALHAKHGNKDIEQIERTPPKEISIQNNEYDALTTTPQQTSETLFSHDSEGVSASTDIAVIGMSGIFPNSLDLNEFWQNLCNQKDLISEVPISRWDWQAFYGDGKNQTKVKWGGFINGVDQFDAAFFNISPAEAELMDPQQRIFLETVWGAIENAGYTSQDLSAIKTGLFVGVSTHDYKEILDRAGNYLPDISIGNAHCVLANRISYLLNLQGPSEAIDTACSSSLFAIHHAIVAIHNHDCELAIVGGVNAILTPGLHVEFSKSGMLSEDGRCKTFDKAANGYVRGEGAGAIILKSLKKALEDKDTIYGVIKGSAVNHGGHVRSLTVPNPNAQADVIMTACERAKVDIGTISYIEAHGTGTSLGDPIEINGLKKAFRQLQEKQGKNRSQTHYCGLGTVKTNIGHLEAAAGIAGVIKVLLAMQYEKLPGILHFKELNPYIEISDTPFYIVGKTCEWQRLKNENGLEIPRRAGISSFGFGGANAHIIIEEPPIVEQPVHGQTKPAYLITLSAKKNASLTQRLIDLEKWIDAIQKSDLINSISLEDISYTLNVGRHHYDKRCIFVVSLIDELKEALANINNGRPSSHYLTTTEQAKPQHEPIFDELLVNIQNELEQHQILQASSYRKKLLSLGNLYIKGYDIDWKKLHQGERKIKIALPTYPFLKERYWVTKHDEILTIQSTPSAVPESSQINTHTMETSMLYYHPLWKQQGLNRDQTNNLPGTNPILVFDPKNSITQALRERFSQRLVLSVTSNNKPTSQYEYHINKQQEDDYTKLLNQLSQQNMLPDYIVYRICPPQNHESTILSDSMINDQLQECYYPFLYLAQALIKLNLTKKIHILCLSEKQCNLPSLFTEALSGFMKTLHLEHPNIVCQLVCVEHLSAIDDVDLLLRELGSHDLEVYYDKDNRRHVKHYESLTSAKQSKPDLAPRKQGVYLITGGAGGLGLIVARYLAKHYQAKLVLTGRSDLKAQLASEMTELEKLGAEVIYIKADVAQSKDLNNLLGTIKSRFGKLNGIIHSAGILRDALIAKKTANHCAQVLTPKIDGTLYLDEITKQEPLDFFVMFSSTAAIFGNIGQCDYAYANAFMDAFATFRDELCRQKQRQGVTISINWPLWEAGGMRVHPVNLEFLKTSLGFVPLQTTEGMIAFHDAFLHNRFIVLSGEKDKISRYITETNKLHNVNQALDVNKSLLLAQVQAYLTNAVSALLKINIHTIEVDKNLSDYNMDSIKFTTFAQQINTYYGITLTPAIFFAYNNIRAISQYMIDTFPQAIAKMHHEQAVATPQYTSQRERAANPLVTSNVTLSTNQRTNTEHLRQPIAIIGMHGIFPQSKSLEDFWEHIAAGDDLITEVPAARWDWHQYYGNSAQDPTKTNSKWGGFIDGVDLFDAAFFNISPREAELMDPQHRLFLETAWKSIEDAGYNPQSLANKDVGVFVGVQFNEYQELLAQLGRSDTYLPTGNSHAVLANRISYLLDLHGPSESIDTACSSALVAIHRAVSALQRNECTLAIAGGVSLMLSPQTFVATSQLGVLSPDGRCKTFDKRANGYVKGEGVGALLLKPLDQALIDGDNIYGIIRGSSVNHGGKAQSLTAPNAIPQAKLIENAYREANINPATVTYIETHGTGTALGDPVEIEGLKIAFNQFKETSTQHHYCGLGTVKTNIGHLEPAAGIAGMVKVLLSMRHSKLPGAVHFKELNPYIDIQNSPFYIVNKTRNWERLKDEEGKDIPHRAGVSSFGFGGSYAHIVIEEGPSHTPAIRPIKSSYLITLSAMTDDALQQRITDLLAYLVTHKDEELSIENISYTMNKGRSQFEKRCAIVASSISELQDTLQTALENQSLPNVFINSNDKEKLKHQAIFKEVFNYIMQDIDKIDQLTSQAYRDKLLAIANFYTEGYNVDWEKLHSGESKKRISLPTYPFVKNRYWIPEHEARQTKDSSYSVTQTKLHPLIDSNISTLETHAFKTLLSNKAFYLHDHRVNDDAVLPGVAYLEMARAAGSLAVPKRQGISIKNIIWSNPIRVTDQPQPAVINLYPEATAVRFEVTTTEENEKPSTVHAQGKIVYSESTSMPVNRLNIDEIKQRCSKQLSNEQIYANYRAIGLQYGPSFQVIQKLFSNETEALAQLQLPEHLKASASEFVLHPSLMDGALQAIAGLHQDQSSLYLPFSLAQLDIFESLPSLCYAYVTKTSEPNAALSKYQIQVVDETGKLLVQIKDFTARVLQAELAKVESPVHYYRPIWSQQNLVNIQAQSNAGPFLVIDNESKTINALRDRWPDQTVIQIKSGNTYKVVNKNEYRLNQYNANDYIKLLKHLKKNELLPKKIIYFLSDPLSNKTSQNDLQISLQENFYRLFYLSQALALQTWKDELSLICVNENNSLLMEPLSSFVKTLHLEHPKIMCHVISFSQLNEQAVKNLIQELSAHDTEVRYDEEGVRYIKRYTLNTPKESDPKPLLKKGGVYLITGGAGGLGLIFSRYMAEHYQAKLLLTGRSELKEQQKAAIAELEKLGAEVIYMKGNVTQQKDVKNLLRTAKSRFGLLNGVIHSAGVLRDAFIVKKSANECTEVLAPKILATLHLDNITQSEPLDFFMMFSSTAAVFGNMGQCDYAYGNGFMDAFAVFRDSLCKQQRRHGKSISINWPLWAEGGMRVDHASEQWLKHILGASPLTTSQGIDAFIEALIQDNPQQIVLAGQKQKLAKYLNIGISAKPSSSIVETTMTSSTDLSRLLTEVQTQLLTSMSKILKVDVDHLSIEEDLTEYGLDSISFMILTNQLNSEYNIELTPTILFEYKTLKSFADYLIKHHQVALETRHQPQLTPVSQPNGSNGQVLEQEVSTKIGKNGEDAEVHQNIEKLPSEIDFDQLYSKGFIRPEQIKIQLVNTSLGLMEVFEAGVGETVLLLPPLESLATVWRHQFVELAKDHHVIALHYPGHGASSFDPEQVNIETIADLFIDILNKTHADPPLHVIGWSFGGIIALSLANKRPDYVKTLTLVSMPLHSREWNSKKMEKFFELIQKEFNHYLKLHKKEKIPFTLKQISGIFSGKVRAHYYSQSLNFDATALLKEIHCPTLIVAGGQDKFVSIDDVVFLNKKIPNSKLYIIRSAGHYIPLFNANHFNRRVKKFLTAYNVKSIKNRFVKHRMLMNGNHKYKKGHFKLH